MEVKNNKQKVITIFLLILIVIPVLIFIIPQFFKDETKDEPVAGETEYAAIQVTSEIENILEEENSVVIDYFYTIENENSLPITSLIVENNLRQSFGNYNFEILSLSSNLNLNSSFDGDTNFILSSGETINPLTSATVSLRVRLFNNGDLGPFDNEISARGVFDFEEEPQEPNDDNDEEEEEEEEGVNPDDYAEETDLTPRDVSLFLTRSNNGTIVTEITDGLVIPSSVIEDEWGLGFSIIVGPDLEGSVRVIIERDGDTEIWEELNFLAYEVDDIDWFLERRGNYKATIQIFSRKNAEGTLINQEVINFSITKDEPQDILTEGSANVSFTLTPSSFPVNPREDQSGGVGRAGNPVIVSSSSSSASLPSTGFGLHNTLVFGSVSIGIILMLGLVSRLVKSYSCHTVEIQ